MGFFKWVMILFLWGCDRHYPPLDTVPKVDINQYTGLWYEIANFPNSFQKNCTGTTAQYSLTSEGEVKVVNKCFKGSLKGELETAEGIAKISDERTNSKLKVSFFWPFFGDYWIIDLAPDYSYAVVGSPSREYLWILSRTPKMDANIYEGIVKKVRDKGFDVTKLKRTIQ